MILPFRFFFGGYLGNGNQWISWIHLDDIVNSILFLLEDVTSAGIFNLTSPEPIQMKDFAKMLGRKLKRPSWFHVPIFLLRAVLGQMADELLLTDQRVYPGNLAKKGFTFQFPTLKLALDDLL